MAVYTYTCGVDPYSHKQDHTHAHKTDTCLFVHIIIYGPE